MAPSKYLQDTVNNNDVPQRVFPYKIEKVDAETNKELLSDFSGERTTFVQAGPKKYFFPGNFEQDAVRYYNFEVRPDDIWIVTFPRSGTTWTQEMVWLLANDLDYETALRVNLNARCPFLEFSTFVHDEVKAEFLQENSHSPTLRSAVENATWPEWQRLPLQENRRIIKTHLPLSFLPPDLLTSGCKVIYVARNPKDVITSFYHLNKLFRTQGYSGDLAKYWSYFKRNLQPWTPYWEHIKEAWAQRDNPNLLFMFYEDMSKDSKSGIVKIANFLDKHLTTEDLDKLDEHLNIKNFRNNPSVNNVAMREMGIIRDNGVGFIGEGKTGKWRDDMSFEVSRDIDDWIAENMKNTDIKFPS